MITDTYDYSSLSGQDDEVEYPTGQVPCLVREAEIRAWQRDQGDEDEEERG